MNSEFSFTSVLQVIDSYPEVQVMKAIAEMYSTSRRGIWSNKFVAFNDLLPLGWKGVRRYLVSIYELDSEFVVNNKGELNTIVRTLQGDD